MSNEGWHDVFFILLALCGMHCTKVVILSWKKHCALRRGLGEDMRKASCEEIRKTMVLLFRKDLC